MFKTYEEAAVAVDDMFAVAYQNAGSMFFDAIYSCAHTEYPHQLSPAIREKIVVRKAGRKTMKRKTEEKATKKKMRRWH